MNTRGSLRSLVIRALLAGVLAGLAFTAGAHHGWSGYNAEKPLNLRGTVKASGYEHPHGFVRLQTPGKLWAGGAGAALPHGEPRPTVRAAETGEPRSPSTVIRTAAKRMRAERITVNDKTVELR